MQFLRTTFDYNPWENLEIIGLLEIRNSTAADAQNKPQGHT